MPNLTIRPAETFELIQEFVKVSQADLQSDTGKTLTPDQFTKASDLAGQERVSFLNLVPAYYEARNRRLTELIEVVDVVSPRSDEMESRWKEQVTGLVEDCARILGPLLSGIDPQTPKGQALRWKILAEETLFANTLASMQLANKWAEVSRTFSTILSMMTYLRVGWETITKEENKIVLLECEIVERTAYKLRGVWDDRRRSDEYVNMSDASDVASRISGDKCSLSKIRGGLDSIESFVERACDGLRRASSAYAECLVLLRANASLLEDLGNTERQSVHRAFRDLRQVTKDFRGDPPDQRAIRLLLECKSQVDNWISNLPTEGLKADAGEVRAGLEPKNNFANVAVTEAYKNFESEFRGRFFDSVSDSTLDELTGRNLWGDRRRWLLSSEPTDDLADMAESVKLYFRSPLGKTFDSLYESAGSMENPDKTTARDEIRRRGDAMLRKYADASAPLLSVISGLSSVLSSSDFRRLLERKDMEDAIKSF